MITGVRSRFTGTHPTAAFESPFWCRPCPVSRENTGCSGLILRQQHVWPTRCEALLWFYADRPSLIPKKPELERRKWVRLPLGVPVFVRAHDDSGKEFLEFATALNVSAGGAQIALRRSLPVASRLVLEIPSAPLAASNVFPKVERVLHAKTVRVTHAEGYHLLGVKFAKPLLDSTAPRPRTRRKLSSV